MSNFISLLPAHIKCTEVSLESGRLQCSITVDRKNRGQEEICYPPSREVHTESALSHQHGPTVFTLDSIDRNVDEVLKTADAVFGVGTSLKQKYGGKLWSKRTEFGVGWEGQSSILVGRCDSSIVGVACLQMHFVSKPESPDTKFFHVRIGPFFVPSKFRGRAHSIEMSIATSHLCSVLVEALYCQLPAFARMGAVVASDFSDHGLEPHPFVDQIFQKIEITQEFLAIGGMLPNDIKQGTISFYSPRLES